MTPFTIPVAMDRFTLWIRQPPFEEGSFNENVQKVLQPFSTELWFTIICTVLVFSLINFIVLPGKTWNEDSKSLNLRSKMHQTATTLAHSISVGFLQFFGGGVEPATDNGPHQVLNFGFGFLIFVAVTAYTANMAAFLTLSGADSYLSSIEEAVTRNTPLCAPHNLKIELTTIYPTANWVFLSIDSEDSLVKAFDEGKCKAIVQGWVDIRGDTDRSKLYCERELVRVGNVVMEKPIAFPANKDIVAGLSHWLSVAEDQGITFTSYMTRDEVPCNLDTVLNNHDADELPQFTIENMALPLTIFALCCVLSVSIWIWTKSKAPSSEKAENGVRGPAEVIENLETTILSELNNCKQFLLHHQDESIDPKEQIERSLKTKETSDTVEC